ncbi:hypothetical protein NE237_027696 [Protea cynaroides]|uniref:Uncharacterized protein n=1 Tax=Protea cynaroides TaxID=273540 RepID=A0A9Q0GP12_9MAGN|nr:hypothetical protein NE237_027696 [Protea cynaroides]
MYREFHFKRRFLSFNRHNQSSWKGVESSLYEHSNGQNPTISSSISRSIPCLMPLKPQLGDEQLQLSNVKHESPLAAARLLPASVGSYLDARVRGESLVNSS